MLELIKRPDKLESTMARILRNYELRLEDDFQIQNKDKNIPKNIETLNEYITTQSQQLIKKIFSQSLGYNFSNICENFDFSRLVREKNKEQKYKQIFSHIAPESDLDKAIMTQTMKKLNNLRGTRLSYLYAKANNIDLSFPVQYMFCDDLPNQNSSLKPTIQKDIEENSLSPNLICAVNYFSPNPRRKVYEQELSQILKKIK